jgi:hypothetical protein
MQKGAINYILICSAYISKYGGGEKCIEDFGGAAEHYWSSSALPPHSSIYSRKKKGPGVPRQLAFSKGKE